MLGGSSIGRQRDRSNRDMPRTPNYLKGTFLPCLLLGTVSGLSAAQVTSQSPTSKAAQSPVDLAPPEYNPAPVEVDARPIFLVYAAFGGLSPEERASNIKHRILDFARQ